MLLSDSLTAAIDAVLFKKSIDVSIHVIEKVSGGSINSCYKLKAGEKCFFLKINDLRKYPRMFFAETEG